MSKTSNVLKLYITCFLITFSLSKHLQAREYATPFTPSKVIVADGYLQIAMPTPMQVEGCSNTKTIVLPDNHKYFDAYLSMATTAFVTNKKLSVAIGSPCNGVAQWPTISVISLQN